MKFEDAAWPAMGEYDRSAGRDSGACMDEMDGFAANIRLVVRMDVPGGFLLAPVEAGAPVLHKPPQFLVLCSLRPAYCLQLVRLAPVRDALVQIVDFGLGNLDGEGTNFHGALCSPAMRLRAAIKS
jgi:hypothetical protein